MRFVDVFGYSRGFVSTCDILCNISTGPCSSRVMWPCGHPCMMMMIHALSASGVNLKPPFECRVLQNTSTNLCIYCWVIFWYQLKLHRSDTNRKPSKTHFVSSSWNWSTPLSLSAPDPPLKTMSGNYQMPYDLNSFLMVTRSVPTKIH